MTKSNTKKAPAATLAPKVVEVTLRPTPDDPQRRFGGSKYAEWNAALVDRTRQTAFLQKDPAIDPDAEMTSSAIVTALGLLAFKPTDAVESMIASQALGLHYAAMECLRRAMIPEQPFEFASKMRKEAANLSRAMLEMCEGLDRRRGKGMQVVRVERVVVGDGGQAIVGAVGHHPAGGGAQLGTEGQAYGSVDQRALPFAPSAAMRSADEERHALSESRGDGEKAMPVARRRRR